MDLRQLRYFSAIYERRSLSRAAQSCSVAQSAISHHLANLEGQLGVRLFDRQQRGMDPTPAGTRLYEHAQAILRSVAAAESDVSSLSDDIMGDILLGLPHTIIDAIGIPLLMGVRERFPKANLIIQEALSSELHRMTLLGELDLALCYNALADERLKSIHIHDEELCCAGRAEFLGTKNDPIEFEEALALPQILLKRGVASRSISTQARLLQSLHSHSVLEINSVNGMHKALAAGIGTAVCPLITVRDLVRQGAVTVRPLRNPSSTRSLHVLKLVDRSPTRLMEIVQAEVVAQIRAQTDDGSWPIVEGSAENTPSA